MVFCKHLQTEGFCSLCSTQLDGLTGVQTGPDETTQFRSQRGQQIGGREHGYSPPPPVSQRGPLTGPTTGFNGLLQNELATMSGCILALSEHTSAERHRILHTISAYFED